MTDRHWEHEMGDHVARTILRRIALGLPLLAGPLFIPVAGCGRECQFVTVQTRHPLNDALRDRVMADCSALGLELDGAIVPDGGGADARSTTGEPGQIDPAAARAHRGIRCNRRRVDEKRRDALESFARELDAEPTPALRVTLGLPDATRAQDLLRAIS